MTDTRRADAVYAVAVIAVLCGVTALVRSCPAAAQWPKPKPTIAVPTKTPYVPPTYPTPAPTATPAPYPTVAPTPTLSPTPVATVPPTVPTPNPSPGPGVVPIRIKVYNLPPGVDLSNVILDIDGRGCYGVVKRP